MQASKYVSGKHAAPHQRTHLGYAEPRRTYPRCAVTCPLVLSCSWAVICNNQYFAPAMLLSCTKIEVLACFPLCPLCMLSSSSLSRLSAKRMLMYTPTTVSPMLIASSWSTLIRVYAAKVVAAWYESVLTLRHDLLCCNMSKHDSAWMRHMMSNRVFKLVCLLSAAGELQCPIG